MNINRHNYEDYFILYLDNELPQGEREAVEIFLQQNPDLQAEMDILQKTIFSDPEPIVFPHKEQLFYNQPSLIDQHNYEAYLVQYADGELDASEMKAIELYMAEQPSKKEELAWIQKTKLSPDTSVVFHHKELLYRHETAKLSPMRWWRQAAAAAAIIILGVGGFLYNPERSESPTELAATPSTTTPAKAPKPVHNNVINTTNEVMAKNTTETTEVRRQTEDQHQPVNQYAEVPAVQYASVTTEDEKVLDIPIGVPVRTEEIYPDTQDAYASLQQQNINTAPVTNEIAPAYNNQEAAETDFTYASAVEPQNKKIRGFFRKATRIIERTANINATNEDDKLLIGAFAVNLK